MDGHLLASIESVWASASMNNTQKKATINVLVAQWRGSKESASTPTSSSPVGSATHSIISGGSGVEPHCDLGDYGTGNGDRVLREADESADSILCAILVAFPSLRGRAVSNFGTALRAPIVREAFAGIQVRNLDLLRVLGYIGDAADAHRHLKLPLLRETTAIALEHLRSATEEVSCDDECASSIAGLDFWEAPSQLQCGAQPVCEFDTMVIPKSETVSNSSLDAQYASPDQLEVIMSTSRVDDPPLSVQRVACNGQVNVECSSCDAAGSYCAVQGADDDAWAQSVREQDKSWADQSLDEPVVLGGDVAGDSSAALNSAADATGESFEVQVERIRAIFPDVDLKLLQDLHDSGTVLLRPRDPVAEQKDDEAVSLWNELCELQWLVKERRCSSSDAELVHRQVQDALDAWDMTSDITDSVLGMLRMARCAASDFTNGHAGSMQLLEETSATVGVITHKKRKKKRGRQG